MTMELATYLNNNKQFFYLHMGRDLQYQNYLLFLIFLFLFLRELDYKPENAASLKEKRKIVSVFLIYGLPRMSMRNDHAKHYKHNDNLYAKRCAVGKTESTG